MLRPGSPCQLLFIVKDSKAVLQCKTQVDLEKRRRDRWDEGGIRVAEDFVHGTINAGELLLGRREQSHSRRLPCVTRSTLTRRQWDERAFAWPKTPVRDAIKVGELLVVRRGGHSHSRRLPCMVQFNAGGLSLGRIGQPHSRRLWCVAQLTSAGCHWEEGEFA